MIYELIADDVGFLDITTSGLHISQKKKELWSFLQSMNVSFAV